MKPMTETLGEKLIRCGWVTNFNVKTLVRLIEEHFNSRTSSTQTPISVNDRLPGPDDCDADGRCWWAYGQHRDDPCWPGDFSNDPRWTLRIDGPNSPAWIERIEHHIPCIHPTHWLPYYAIQIPTYTKTTNET